MKRLLTIITVGLLWSAASVTSVASAQAEGWSAITKPSEVRTLSFVRPGLIAKLVELDDDGKEVEVEQVKEGSRVVAGQVVARQDDQAEQLQLKILQLQAEDTTRIEYAQAAYDQAKVDQAKTEKAYQAKAATKMELEHARLNLLIEDAKLKLAHIEAKERMATYKQTKIQVDRMKLVTPIAGRVERIFYKEGELAEAMGKMVIIVQINPLWIEVPVPIGHAKGLAVGRIAKVRFNDGVLNAEAGTAGGKTVEGEVIHKASVANAASNTLMVRVEIPNPSEAGRPAGEHVRVSFPAARAAGEGVSGKDTNGADGPGRRSNNG